MSAVHLPIASDTFQAPPINGSALRRYLLLYGLAVLSMYVVVGGTNTVLLAMHVQGLELAKHFGAAAASINLVELQALKVKVDAGMVTANAEQLGLLQTLTAFEAAKAKTLSMTTSVGLAFTLVLQPLFGVMSDRTRSRMGRRSPWILLGTVFIIAGLACLQYSTSATELLLSWLLTSAGITALGGPLAATLVDRVPEEKLGVGAAINGIAMLLGWVLGAAVAGALYSKIGIRSYIPFGALPAILCLAFVMFTRDTSSSSMKVAPAGPLSHLKSFTFALRDGDFRWVWIARVTMMFGYSICGAFSVYMLQSYIQPGLSAEQAAKTMPLILLAGAPGTLISMVISGRWSDKTGRKKPFVIGSSLLLASSMVIPLVWPALPALYIQNFVAGIAIGAYLVVDQALLIAVLPDKEAAARDLGIGNVASNLGSAIGPIVAGTVVSLTGGYGMVWLASMVIVTIAALAIVPVRKVR